MHRDAHVVILALLEESLVWTKHFASSLTLLNDSVFNSFFKLIKGVFVLKSGAERAIEHLKDLGTLFSLRIISFLLFLCWLGGLLFAAALFLAFGRPLALLPTITGNVIIRIELLVKFLRLYVIKWRCFDVERGEVVHASSNILHGNLSGRIITISFKRPEYATATALARKLILHELIDGAVLGCKGKLIVPLIYCKP